MDESSIVSFFNAVLEDDIEKDIIQLIASGLEPEEILEKLLLKDVQGE